MKNSFSVVRWQPVFNRLSGQVGYPHELAFLLDLPLWKLIFSVRQVADRLHLTSETQVLKIGRDQATSVATQDSRRTANIAGYSV